MIWQIRLQFKCRTSLECVRWPWKCHLLRYRSCDVNPHIVHAKGTILTVSIDSEGMQQAAVGRLYRFFSYAVWPGIFVGGLIGAGFAFKTTMPLLWFNVVYLAVITLIALFERLMPYEQTWLARDG